MKYTAAALFILLVASLPYHAAGENINLVLNPSFEFKYTSNSYGKIPLYWSRYTGGSGSIDLSSQAQQGDYALMLIDNSATGAVGLWTEPITVVPGRTYDLRCWCMRSALSTTPQLSLRFYDKNNTLLHNPSVNVGAIGSWEAGGASVTTPAGASYARILLYSDNASRGTAFFDCVSLTLAEQRISDGAFEDVEAGDLPAHWSVAYTHPGAIQDIQYDHDKPKGLVLLIGSESTGGQTRNRSLRLYDNSATGSCGAGCDIPASPGVPYKLTAMARKADGSGSASIYMKFYNAAGTQIATCSTNTSSTRYVPLTLEAIAPAKTAFARALCYMTIPGTGTAYFDNISFTENYTLRYAAPAQVGNGAGTSALTAAAYTSTAFWNNVNAAAANGPVKVVLLSGNYTKHLSLPGIGNSTNQILITGEKPFAMHYSATTSLNEFLRVVSCRNLVFRHLHFSAIEKQADLDAKNTDIFDYQYVLRIGASGYTTTDIRCEGVTFTGMLMVHYGITGAHFEGTSNITWDRCAWTRSGWDSLDHCIYNANDSSNLLVKDCYFQDCNGAYVRFRNRSTGTVSGCTFIATGTQPSGNSGNRRNHTFIQLAAFNPADQSRNESIGADFTFSNNSFTYEYTVANAGDRNAFDIYVSGIPPVNNPIYHLVPKSEGTIIADKNANAATRISLIKKYFGIDLAADCTFNGNTFSGCWSQRFTLRCSPANTAYWRSANQDCELDNLVGID